MSALVVATTLLLLASGFFDHGPALFLAPCAALCALVAAHLVGGRRALIESLVAALIPCAVTAVLIPDTPGLRLIMFPLAAAALEVAAVTRLIEIRQPLIEAWLCAGARPLEVLPRVRPRVRPAILVALALLVPVIANPVAKIGPAVIASLVGIGVAAVLAAVLVTVKTFVDGRLVDRPPAEARSPFRLEAYEAPPTPRVYETRPGRQPPPAA